MDKGKDDRKDIRSDYGNRKKFHFDNIYMENPQPYEHVNLYQIGDLSCEAGYTIGDHVQCCYEISYITAGKGLFFTNGKSYSVHKGDIYLSLPGECHNGIADKADPFRFFYVGFNLNEFPSVHNPLTHICRMYNQVRVPVLQDKFDIQQPFLNIFNEILNTKNYSDLMIKTCLHQIVVLAYRNFFERWEKEYTPHSDVQSSKKLVYGVINYIDTHTGSIESLSDIAEHLGYSYTYLSKVFTHETGFSIQEYYNKKRFEKALKLLKASDSNITHIAEALKYQSIHSFSKAFRKYYGISPTEYQELNKVDKKGTTES